MKAILIRIIGNWWADTCAALCIIMVMVPLHASGQFPLDPDTVQFEAIDTEPLGDGGRLLISDHLGRIWISGHNGIFCHNGFGYERLLINLTNEQIEISPWGQRSFRGTDNRMWFVLFHSGVLVLDISSGDQEFISPAELQGHDHFDHIWNVKDIGPGDSLVIHTDRGFAFLDQNSWELSPFFIPFENDAAWEQFAERECNYHSAVRDIARFPNTKDEYLILSYVPYRYNSSTGEVRHFGTFANEISENVYLYPRFVFEEGNEFWITGYSFGFRQVNAHTGKITDYHYEEQTSDPHSNTVTDYVRLGDSICIFAGSEDLGLFNLRSKKYALFKLPKRDTTQERPYHASVALDAGGHLWWASRFNVYRSVQPVITPSVEPPFYVSLNNVDGIRQPQFQHLGRDQAVQVSRSGSFSFKYHLINPGNEKEVRYTHRLAGYDDVWVESNPLVHNRYAQLRPGNYILELRAYDDVRGMNRTTSHAVRVDAFWYDHWYSKAGLAVLALGLLGFLMRVRGQKIRIEERLKLEYENKLTQLEMNALRAQMNPHFVFNSMNSIKSYLVRKGPDEAADYLTKFGYLIRVILENSKHDILTLEQELKAIRLYVEMENKRFKQPFEFELDIDPDIDLLYAQIPPMLIQPYVENAIWHGLMPKKSARKLRIQIIKVADGMLCIVEDNGVGRSVNQQPSDPLQTKASLGHQITSDRIATINKIHNCDIRVEIEDLQDTAGGATGTRVKLYISGLRN